MAFYPCNKSGIGTETVLWTNPNPNAEFGYTVATLSTSITSFDMLAIEYKVGISSSSKTSKIYVGVNDFKTNYGNADSGTWCRLGFGTYASNYSNSHNYVRTALYKSDTQIQFNSSLYNDYQVSANKYNTANIPTKIIGIKF